jgi:Tfp pilus assembly protein PilF
LWVHLPWAFVALVPALLALWRAPALARMLLLFAVLACLGFLALGFFQVRFFMNVGGPEICVMLVVLAFVLRRWSMRTQWIVVGVLAVLFGLPERIYRLHASAETVRQRQVSRLDAIQPLFRDIAAALRASQPEGDIVLLTNPDASTGIGYYGRLKTIGTLYWENLDGIKAAAAMSSTTSRQEARKLFRARGVTHFAVISEQNFVQEYFDLSHPGAAPEAWHSGFAFQMFSQENVPLWLEPIPYTVPADIPMPDARVVLYKTRFGPPGVERALDEAQTQLAANNRATAEQTLRGALAEDPGNVEISVMLADLAITRGDLDAATAATQNAVSHSAPARQPQIVTSLANVLYLRGAHALAANWYRTALNSAYDAGTAVNLAWLLATSHDDAVRDPATALSLAQRAAGELPDAPGALNALAAALAANGRFAEAVQTAQHALEVTRATNADASTVATAEARVRAYQSEKVWRQ